MAFLAATALLPVVGTIGVLGAPASEQRLISPEGPMHHPLPSCYQQDLEAALRLAEQEQRWVLIAFLGGEWCPWSEKFQQEVLEDKEFLSIVLSQAIPVALTYRVESAAADHAAVRSWMEQYRVTEFPTLLFLHASGSELFRMGFAPLAPSEYARVLKERIEEYRMLEKVCSGSELLEKSRAELISLYRDALRVGHEPFVEQILATGLLSDQDDYFLFEAYARLLRSGKKKDVQAKELRKRLIRSDQRNQHGVRYRLALLDCERTLDHSQSKEKATSAMGPLLKYIREYGKQDREHLWQAEMTVAQLLYAKEKWKEALQHAEAAVRAAPDTERPHLEEMVAFLREKSQATATR